VGALRSSGVAGRMKRSGKESKEAKRKAAGAGAELETKGESKGEEDETDQAALDWTECTEEVRFDVLLLRLVTLGS
jgi:ribosomal protein S25